MTTNHVPKEELAAYAKGRNKDAVSDALMMVYDVVFSRGTNPRLCLKALTALFRESRLTHVIAALAAAEPDLADDTGEPGWKLEAARARARKFEKLKDQKEFLKSLREAMGDDAQVAKLMAWPISQGFKWRVREGLGPYPDHATISKLEVKDQTSLYDKTNTRYSEEEKREAIAKTGGKPKGEWADFLKGLVSLLLRGGGVGDCSGAAAGKLEEVFTDAFAIVRDTDESEFDFAKRLEKRWRFCKWVAETYGGPGESTRRHDEAAYAVLRRNWFPEEAARFTFAEGGDDKFAKILGHICNQSSSTVVPAALAFPIKRSGGKHRDEDVKAPRKRGKKLASSSESDETSVGDQSSEEEAPKRRKTKKNSSSKKGHKREKPVLLADIETVMRQVMRNEKTRSADFNAKDRKNSGNTRKRNARDSPRRGTREADNRAAPPKRVFTVQARCYKFHDTMECNFGSHCRFKHGKCKKDAERCKEKMCEAFYTDEGCPKSHHGA